MVSWKLAVKMNVVMLYYLQEKMLPGVVMSNGGQVFEKLYQLASLDQPRYYYYYYYY